MKNKRPVYKLIEIEGSIENYCGSVLITGGKYKGKVGYYDDDDSEGYCTKHDKEFDQLPEDLTEEQDEAFIKATEDCKLCSNRWRGIVYLDGPFNGAPVSIPHKYLQPIEDPDHEEWKRENPELVQRAGID